MRRTTLLLFVFILILHPICHAQTHSTAGGYSIRHYGVKSYGMHPRNFYIAQDNREIMYFGNAYGLIEYDGKTWKDINLPDGNSGLSITLAKNGTLYVGAFNELGYLKPNQSGHLVYHSLYDKIPKTQQLNRDILQIIESTEGILFQSELGIHIYKNDTFQTIQPSTKGNLFSYLQKKPGRVVVQVFL